MLNVFPKRLRHQLLGAIIIKFWWTKINFYAQLYGIMFINSMLLSILDTARPYSTIFYETILFLSLIVARCFNVLYKICIVANISQKSYCSHHISLPMFLQLTDNNWVEIWKMSELLLFFFEGLFYYPHFIVRLRTKVRDMPIEFQLIVNSYS